MRLPGRREPLNGAALTTTRSTPLTNGLLGAQGIEVSHHPFGRAHVPTIPTGSPFALNVGAHCAILLGCSASSTLSHQPVSFKRQLYPTFTTYNIKFRYSLKWSIHLLCAGEEQSVSGEAPVTVLAPSEEQEERKQRELGSDGMKKNHDDLEVAAGLAAQSIGQLLTAFA